jgi:hypothetical protein
VAISLDEVNFTPYVARTVNGTSWTYAKLPSTDYAAVAGQVSCPAVKLCLSVGGGFEGEVVGAGVIRSTDGGQTWTAEPVPGGANVVPAAIACQSNTDSCEVVGGYRTNTYPLSDLSAASTTDGGTTWDAQLP